MKSIDEAQREIIEYVNENYKEHPFTAIYTYCTDDYEMVLKSEKYLNQEIIGDTVHISTSTVGNVYENRCYYKVKMSRKPFRIYVFSFNRDRLWVPYISSRIELTAKYIEKPINSIQEYNKIPTYLDLDEDTLYLLEKEDE